MIAFIFGFVIVMIILGAIVGGVLGAIAGIKENRRRAALNKEADEAAKREANRRAANLGFGG